MNVQQIVTDAPSVDDKAPSALINSGMAIAHGVSLLIPFENSVRTSLCELTRGPQRDIGWATTPLDTRWIITTEAEDQTVLIEQLAVTSTVQDLAVDNSSIYSIHVVAIY